MRMKLSRTRVALLPLLAMMAMLLTVSPALAEDTAPAPLLPPLTGQESTQTYMQAVWVMIIFLVMLAILYPTAWKNVLAGLKKREDRIRGDIAAAEQARLKAESTLKEYNSQLSAAEDKVRALLSQAATEAEKIGASIRLRAQEESEEIKDRATKDIQAARQQAMAEIYEQTANLSTTIAEKILRRNLNADDQRELVNESLKQLQTVNV